MRASAANDYHAVQFSGEHVDGVVTTCLKDGQIIHIGSGLGNNFIVPCRGVHPYHVKVVNEPGVGLFILNLSDNGTICRVDGGPEKHLDRKEMKLHLVSSCVCDLIMPIKAYHHKGQLRIRAFSSCLERKHSFKTEHGKLITDDTHRFAATRPDRQLMH
ncbi:unnamed protein product [Prorocentrum cordatum]|uniref:Uncharacterized protein n=1 Tax=Prorocentrum cordatum TaxID=2364126 RepID=A0ABN9W1K7_9DINO|nr:unnamed protein product [Polarella glacialis]